MIKVLAHLRSLVSGTHACPRCRLWIQLTGETPRDPSERLILSIVGDRGQVPVHWLEDHLARELYDAELRQGGASLDIGVWGPFVFPEEAARILQSIRPEFAHVTGTRAAPAPQPSQA